VLSASEEEELSSSEEGFEGSFLQEKKVSSGFSASALQSLLLSLLLSLCVHLELCLLLRLNRQEAEVRNQCDNHNELRVITSECGSLCGCEARLLGYIRNYHRDNSAHAL
jgi:hypothetical protein